MSTSTGLDNLLGEGSTVGSVWQMIKVLTFKQIIAGFSTLGIIAGSIFAAGTQVQKTISDIECNTKIKPFTQQINDLTIKLVSQIDYVSKVKNLEDRNKFLEDFVEYLLAKKLYSEDSIPFEKLQKAQEKIETKLIKK